MYDVYDPRLMRSAQRPATTPAAPARQAPPTTAFDLAVFAGGVVLLFIYSAAWAAPVAGYDYPHANAALLRNMNFPAYAIGMTLLAMHWERAIKACLQNWVLLLLVGMTVASTWWSVDPPATERRAIGLVFMTLSALGLAVRFSWEDLSEVIAATFGIIAVLGFLLGAFYPAWGRMHELFPGAWRGTFLEKNGLGGMMSAGAILMAAAGIYNPRRRIMWLGGAGLCLLLVLLSTSKTSLLISLIGAAVMALIWLVRRSPATAVVGLWGLGAAIIGLVALFMFAPGLAFKAVGKDATLTGRTQIWSAAIHQLVPNKWLGFGYGVLWERHEHWYPAAKIFKEAKFEAGHAHNGWLETTLSVGLVGLAVWTVYFLQVCLRGAVRLFTGGGAYLCLPYLIMFTLRSATEVSILDFQDIHWALFVAFGAKLALDKFRGGTDAA